MPEPVLWETCIFGFSNRRESPHRRRLAAAEKELLLSRDRKRHSRCRLQAHTYAAVGGYNLSTIKIAPKEVFNGNCENVHT
jgi:hypothetical protein